MPINALTNTNAGLARRIKTPVTITNLDTGQTVDILGVWDTGAESSVLRQDIVTLLGLKQRGFKTIIGVTGQSVRQTYFANLKLNNQDISLDMEITGVDSFSSDPKEAMLIGMDVIQQGDFSISNFGGHTVMSFRRPSQKKIDYCEETAQYNKYLKIHQAWIKHGNNKCPCQSGKVWEKCHGKIVE